MEDLANMAGRVPANGGKSVLINALYKATTAYGVQLIKNPTRLFITIKIK